MRDKTRRVRSMVVGALLGGSLLAGGCIPENFWATQWENMLSGVAETVITDPVVAAFSGVPASNADDGE